MSKRGTVSYIKPREPAFLTRLKAEAGYKEGPNVGTKREQLPACCSSDESDGDDQPTIVVLRTGDLTSEEAAKAKTEQETRPADLSKRVIFKRPEDNKKKRKADKVGEGVEEEEAEDTNKKGTKKKEDKEETKKKQKTKGGVTKSAKASLLSFDQDEEEQC